MNEWTFAAQIASWWEQQFSHNPEWKLNRCEVETQASSGRSDLCIIGSGVVHLCGELRLPDHSVPDPWHPDNLLNAINKATILGSRWAFTSDSVSFVLVDCNRPGAPISRVVQVIQLIEFKNRNELDSQVFLQKVQGAWVGVIQQVAPVITGLVLPKGITPDELLINSLRALLASPVAAIPMLKAANPTQSSYCGTFIVSNANIRMEGHPDELFAVGQLPSLR